MTGTKKFTGAPFGTQKSRFDISAVYPKTKKPGTYTQVSYCRIANSKENQLLGPGTYETEQGDFTESRIQLKSSGPNWKRAFESAQLSNFPRMLYKEQWLQKRLLVQQLGPGRYAIKDFLDDSKSRPSSKRGICEARASRFSQENKFQAGIPGPGTYGKSGVPSARMEERSQKSFCMTGLMEGTTGRSETTKDKGSGIAPGCYSYNSPTEELLNKTVGNRGPYDLYSGKRIPDIKEINQLAPGSYDHKPFTSELNNHHHKKHGQFSTYPQYPMPPTERIYCSTLSQWPRPVNEPNPGHYEHFRKRISSAPCKVPFNSGAKRSVKAPIDPVGPGQYNIDRWDSSQHINACQSVFLSKAPRLPPNVNSAREKLLKERLQPKHIAEGRRLLLLSVEAPC